MRQFLLITVCAVLVACGGTGDGPEAALRAWVEAMELAAEDKDRSAMLDRISPNYADARGNSRKDIGDALLMYFLRQQRIEILTSIDEITVHADTAARVLLTAGMAGTDTSGMGISADAYIFDLELELAGDDWLLIGSRWGELGQGLN